MPAILIAEEHDDTRALYVCCFRHAGFDTLEAGDGREALIGAVANPPDAIVANLSLPVLDGIGLKSRLAHDTRTAAVPFLLLTARLTDEVYQRASAAGIECVLPKPCLPDDLLARVQFAIARSQELRRQTIDITARSRETRRQAGTTSQEVCELHERTRETLERVKETLNRPPKNETE